jgi:ribosomal protein L37E
MFEEPLLLARLNKGKCPDCGSNRYNVYEEALVAIATLKGEEVEVNPKDERNSTTTVKCKKCDKQIYED